MTDYCIPELFENFQKKIFWWNYINIYLKLVFELKTHITMNFQEWKKDIFKRIYIESVLTTKTFRTIFLFNEFVVLFLIFEKPLLQHQSNIPPQIFSRKYDGFIFDWLWPRAFLNILISTKGLKTLWYLNCSFWRQKFLEKSAQLLNL